MKMSSIASHARFQDDEVDEVEEVVDDHHDDGQVVGLLEFGAAPLDVDPAGALLLDPLQNPLLLRHVELLEDPGQEEDEAERPDPDADPSGGEIGI